MARFAKDLYIYNDTLKKDFNDLEFDKKFKYTKKPWIPMVMLIFLVLATFIGIFTSLFILLTDIIFFGLFLITLSKYMVIRQNAKVNAFIQLLLDERNNSYRYISPLFNLYVNDDRDNKHFILNYQNTNYIDLPYSDIKSYKLLVDKVELKNKKLSTTKLDYSARSYIIKITLSNDSEINIGFSNGIKCLSYDGRYVLTLTENTKTINILTTYLDDIISLNK